MFYWILWKVNISVLNGGTDESPEITHSEQRLTHKTGDRDYVIIVSMMPSATILKPAQIALAVPVASLANERTIKIS